MALLVLLAEASELDESVAICALKAVDHRVGRHLRQRVELLGRAAHLGRLLERGLDRDPAGLGLDEVLVELGDRGA